jgi:hypothetical protein
MKAKAKAPRTQAHKDAEGGSVIATETWWYHDAYCDWAPIRPHPTRPCLGGCGTQIDGIDDFCLRCGKAKQETK